MGCQNHPDVLETRICNGCHAHWCDECPRMLANRQVCPACGHQVASYVVVRSLFDSIADAFGRVFSLEAVVTSAAIAIPNALTAIGGIWSVIFQAALVSYYFVIIRHVGDGRRGMPGPSDAVVDFQETLLLAWRGLICTVVGFLPLVIWVVRAIASDSPSHGAVDHDPHVDLIPATTESRSDAPDLVKMLGLVLLGQLYMPAVILAVTVTNSTWAALYPVAWVQIISRAPGRYMSFAFVWVGTVMVGFGVWTVSSMLLPPTMIGAYGAGFFWCMFCFAQAVLVGNYLRENGSAFGWDIGPTVADLVVHDPPTPVIDRGERPRTPSRMPSSIPLDRPSPPPREIAIEPRRTSSISYVATTITLSRAGIDATREDGSRIELEWNDVAGIVARRLPPGGDEITIVDIIAGPGATVRLVPRTQIIGFSVEGSPDHRARSFITFLHAHCEAARLDAKTQEFVAGKSDALQFPDAETLAEHDRRIA